MKQAIMNHRYRPAPLRGHGSAHTVLLRMAEDEGRAARIADLKAQHPRLTWSKIAEDVGVTERAATAWQRTGAMKPENAEALARVFGVDFDYIWSGPRPETPELFMDRRDDDHRIAGHLARIETALELAASERQEIAALLAQQTEALEQIRKATTQADAATATAQSTVATLERLIDEATRGFPVAARDREGGAVATERTQNPEASS